MLPAPRYEIKGYQMGAGRQRASMCWGTCVHPTSKARAGRRLRQQNSRTTGRRALPPDRAQPSAQAQNLYQTCLQVSSKRSGHGKDDMPPAVSGACPGTALTVLDSPESRAPALRPAPTMTYVYVHTYIHVCDRLPHPYTVCSDISNSCVWKKLC